MANQPSSDADDASTPAPTLPPGLRTRRDQEGFTPPEGSTGYTSRGHVQHFLPDREVNLGALNKALADVFGEPALTGRRLELEIDQDYWDRIASDPWSGNVYKYNF